MRTRHKIKRMSLRTLFGCISAIAVILAIVSWRLRQHTEWTKLERDLAMESVRFDGRQQFDWGWPAFLGFNANHPTGAVIDVNTQDATRLADLPTIERVIIFGTDVGTPWPAKLPSSVSATRLSQFRSVPLRVDQEIARWGKIEVAKFHDKDWSIQSARMVAQSNSIQTLTCDDYGDSFVDDRVAEELLRLSSLRKFGIGSSPQITDATIDRLARFPQLKKVYFSSPQVTSARVEWLRKRLPETEVVFRRDTD